MRFPSQMAQDEGVISDSKLTDVITWFQTLPEQGQALLDQNGWLLGGLVAFIGLAFLLKIAKN